VRRDRDGKALTGESAVIPGEPYTVWLLAEPGAVVQAEAAGKPLAVEQSNRGGLLKAMFQGTQSRVTWSVR
jgi:hypothetical protein